jgi:hypothetical protein
MTPNEFEQAVILHFVQNFRETTNVYQLAERRIFEVRELFRALAESEKPRERPESDRTREVRVTLEKLNETGDL